MEGVDLLACPRCRGDLEEGKGAWTCSPCGITHRGLRGIPDLRTREDGYLLNAEDWAFARQLDEDFDRLDFRGLLDRYFELSPEIPADLRKRQIEHILTAPGRACRWLETLEPRADSGPILDLGCGSGSFLAAVGGGGRAPWGVDIAMRWLLVARKRLDEEGLGHIRLVCGCAERLPLRARAFAGVVAGDVIEHVGDQADTLAEAYRVLIPGGRLVMASPNRFSLAPEPHVQVWGVGFLPRRWMSPYVRWRRGVDFRSIRTLGFGGWTRLLRASPFGEGDVRAPGLTEGDLSTFAPIKRRLALVYNHAVRRPAGQAIARAVGPLFHVVCTRPLGSPRTPTRATLRRSTPTAARGSSAANRGTARGTSGSPAG